MSADHPRRTDPRTTPAEELLREAGVECEAEREALADLIAAAAAPGRAGELTGEQAALAAFRRAHTGGRERPRRFGPRHPRIAFIGTAAAVVTAFALVVGGGLPNEQDGAAAPAPPAASTAPGTPPPATDRPLIDRAPAPGQPPDLLELCGEYLAAPDALSSAELERLATAARVTRDPEDDEEEIGRYCDHLTARA
ncbi:hypothetical protein GCM10027168_00610 [Streptomyces capparidis]